jgi:hypothetical protein
MSSVGGAPRGRWNTVLETPIREGATEATRRRWRCSHVLAGLRRLVIRRLLRWLRRHWYGSNAMASEIEGASYEESDEDESAAERKSAGTGYSRKGSSGQRQRPPPGR